MAFYQPGSVPSRFVSTRHTQGPWDPDLQHGGPPSALLARAIEQTPTTLEGEPQVTRMTVDILGPVPITELTVSAQVTRQGKSVELLEATISAGERILLRAGAWRMVRRTLDLPLPAVQDEPPGLPPVADDIEWDAGYLHALEWRFQQGNFSKPGPAVVWARQRVPLVAGEEPTGLQRLMALADSGNGVSSLLDPARWYFINTELTVHVYRQPVGEWLCLSARTRVDASGAGLADSELFDRSGRVGRGAQALMVAPRG